MKTVSKKDLDKLKGKGWKLTPESRKAAHEQGMASTLSKQVEAIANLKESIDGVSEAVRAENANITNKISENLKSLAFFKETKNALPTTAPEPDGWKFIVKRSPDGLIAEIVAERI